MTRLLALFVLLAAAPSPGAAARFVTPDTPGDPLVVRELSAEDLAVAEDAGLADALRVFVASGDPVPSMLGTHSVGEGELRFVPRFPWEPGVEYRAILTLGGDSGEIRFLIPEHPLEPTATVRRVYPTPDTIPANTLRFYVYFSEPMRGGDLYRNVRLLDATGAVVEQAFVETVPELWDPEMHRATLIVHPGRVKQGLEMGDRMGPVFRVGESYRLVVEPEIRTARGLPLAEGFTRRYTVGEEDRTSPDPEAWTVVPPPAGTRDPLRLDLDEPLDHAIVPRMLQVTTRTEPVTGTWAVLGADDEVYFVPVDPWEPGEYGVTVAPDLEDLAGNRVDMLFDRKETPAADDRHQSGLRFTVSP
jgi:hypothetical protein